VTFGSSPQIGASWNYHDVGTQTRQGWWYTVQGYLYGFKRHGTQLKIIPYRYTIYDNDYQAATIIADIDTLQTRRETLSAKFFIRNVLDNTSCLNYLLPERRDPEVISRFRHPRTYEITRTRTGHFQNSYIPYCLANYQ
jgi:hypothetical protein